jgi:hypothetical protein
MQIGAGFQISQFFYQFSLYSGSAHASAATGIAMPSFVDEEIGNVTAPTDLAAADQWLIRANRKNPCFSPAPLPPQSNSVSGSNTPRKSIISMASRKSRVNAMTNKKIPTSVKQIAPNIFMISSISSLIRKAIDPSAESFLPTMPMTSQPNPPKIRLCHMSYVELHIVANYEMPQQNRNEPLELTLNKS